MASLTRTQYKDSFDKLVSKYAKLLNQLDRLEGKKGQIADNMKRAIGNKSKLKKIARDQVKYDKAMENWRKAEAKLLGFRLKELKKPKV